MVLARLILEVTAELTKLIRDHVGVRQEVKVILAKLVLHLSYIDG